MTDLSLALRAVSAASDQLNKAADAMERMESIEQAVAERLSHISSLDGEVAKRVDVLNSLTEKSNAIAAAVAESERNLATNRDSRLAAVDMEVAAKAKAHLDAMEVAWSDLQRTADALEANKASLTSEVDALTKQRDLLLSEIDSAKQRVANL